MGVVLLVTLVLSVPVADAVEEALRIAKHAMQYRVDGLLETIRDRTELLWL